MENYSFIKYRILLFVATQMNLENIVKLNKPSTDLRGTEENSGYQKLGRVGMRRRWEDIAQRTENCLMEE